LDEPSMGLAPLMVQKVFETIRTVAAEGVTMLLIEQNAKLALEVSNRGYVMESGEVTLSGESRELLDSPAVRAAYLGETT
ncbi:MAG: ABC transporter ATP-binding protein, partial [Casimicrobiaceae bacterium]